jgi:outer membrane protein OmpA-like peptidoglycan-associated protein
MTGLYFTRLTSAVAGSLLLILNACAPTSRSGDADTPPKSFVIFFRTDSAELTPEALLEIELIAEEAQRIRATGVGIVGYSGSAGAPAVNLRLSEQRAVAVETALLARNVPPDIIVRTYHGATEVVDGQIEGQRVEVVVTHETRR